MSDIDEIMNFFTTAAAQNQEIRLVNEYKGIPLSYTAQFIEIGRSSIRIRVEKYQIVCLYRERFTVIQSIPLGRNIHAKVMLLDIEKMEVLLSKFTYANIGTGQRKYVRVEPEQPISGVIIPQKVPLAVQGDLADISEDGLGVIVSQTDFFPQVHYKGNQVKIHMQLPIIRQAPPKKIDLIPLPTFDIPARYEAFSPIAFERKEDEPERPSIEMAKGLEIKNEEVTLHGTIVNIKSELLNRQHRLGIRIEPNDPARGAIGRFISRRQNELMREIKTMYEMLSMDQKGIIT